MNVFWVSVGAVLAATAAYAIFKPKQNSSNNYSSGSVQGYNSTNSSEKNKTSLTTAGNRGSQKTQKPLKPGLPGDIITPINPIPDSTVTSKPKVQESPKGAVAQEKGSGAKHRNVHKNKSSKNKSNKGQTYGWGSGSCTQYFINELIRRGYLKGNPGTANPQKIAEFAINNYCWKSRAGRARALQLAKKICKDPDPNLNRLAVEAFVDFPKIDFNAYADSVFDEARAIRDRLISILPKYLLDKRRGRPVEGYIQQAKNTIKQAEKFPPEIFFGLYAVDSNPDRAEMFVVLQKWLNEFSKHTYTKDELLIRDWKSTRLWTRPLRDYFKKQYAKLNCTRG